MTLRELIKEAIDQAPDEQSAEIFNFIRFISLRKNPATLQERLEDRADIRDAEAALAEGESIPAEEFFQELGI
jgi:AmiR/NasT family two-component response regulator